MRIGYVFGGGVVGLLSWGTPRASLAQAPPVTASDHLSPWLLKGGLRLTHLSYRRTTTSWQLLLPWSLAAEYRLGSRFSWCAQFDADMQVASTSLRRGRRAPVVGTGTTVPAVSLGLGPRFYYGHPAGAATRQPGVPELGKYLALEASATLSQPNTPGARPGGRSASSRSLLAPALYALWGVQNRLRPHTLYDLNAGLGVLAPTRSAGPGDLRPHHGWDVGAQVNIRLYFAN